MSLLSHINAIDIAGICVVREIVLVPAFKHSIESLMRNQISLDMLFEATLSSFNFTKIFL